MGCRVFSVLAVCKMVLSDLDIFTADLNESLQLCSVLLILFPVNFQTHLQNNFLKYMLDLLEQWLNLRK